jgi:thymidylate synthase ThyX
MGPGRFYLPPELESHPLRGLYLDTLRLLFETYQQALEPVRAAVAARTPRTPDESEAAYERRLRSDYVDVCRFLLPAAALANVGVTINARALEHALRKMLSHPLAEVRQVGEEIKAVSEARLPTLIKYVERVPYLEETALRLGRDTEAVPPAREEDWCRLAAYDADGEERVLAAALYRYGTCSFDQALTYVKTAEYAERLRLAHDLLGRRGRHDIPLRELEFAGLTYDLTLDQGGYFELKRHRMMTQTVQSLSTLLGYALPRRMVEAGMEEAYRRAMQAAHQAYRRLGEVFPAVASYVVPNGYNRRVLLVTNLRSAMHLLSLRSAANAHFSMRRVAQRMADQVRTAFPLLGAYVNTFSGETWRMVEMEHFSATNVSPES